MMAFLLIGMRLGANALERGDQRLAQLDRSLTIVEVIDGQLVSAVPRFVLAKDDRGSTPYLCFRGEPRELRFLTRGSLFGDRSRGLWLATYRVVKTEDGREQLTAGETAMLDSAGLQAALLGTAAVVDRTATLGDPAERIVFSYLQPGVPPNPPEWVPEWNPGNQQALPVGVRIQAWREGRVGELTFAIPVRTVEQ